MTRPLFPPRPTPLSGADQFDDPAVARLYVDLVEFIGNLDDRVEIDDNGVDVRAQFAGETLARVVPYRELMHVSIGEEPVWEARLRDHRGWMEAADRVLEVFVERFSRTRTRKSALPSTA